MHTPFFLEPSLWDGALLLLILAITGLSVLTALFAITTVWLRFSNIRKASRWERLEAAWEPAILEVLAGAATPESFVKRVRQGDQLWFVDFLLRYVRRLRGAEREILFELARPFLAHVVQRTRESDPERRARAVQTLGLLGPQDHPHALLAALDDPSPLVAMIAARTLARQEYPQRTEAVLARLHRFESWSPPFLTSLLAAMGPTAIPALRRTLADHGRSPRVRAVTADALRHLNDLAAADLADQILRTHPHRDLAAAILRLLGHVGRPEHLPSIRPWRQSPDAIVRAHAVEALGRLGSTDDLQYLREAFEDPSPWVALHAARGITRLGDLHHLQATAASNHPRAALARQVLTENRP